DGHAVAEEVLGEQLPYAGRMRQHRDMAFRAPGDQLRADGWVRAQESIMVQLDPAAARIERLPFDHDALAAGKARQRRVAGQRRTLRPGLDDLRQALGSGSGVLAA